MLQKTLSVGVIALIIGAGIGYFGAMAFAQTPTKTADGQSGYGGGTRGMMMRSGGGFVAGTVASKSTGSVTVTTGNGNSRVVLLSGSTQVEKSIQGTTDDVAVGSQVLVAGASNQDGSMSAQSITIRPAGSASLPGFNPGGPIMFNTTVGGQ